MSHQEGFIRLNLGPWYSILSFCLTTHHLVNLKHELTHRTTAMLATHLSGPSSVEQLSTCLMLWAKKGSPECKGPQTTGSRTNIYVEFARFRLHAGDACERFRFCS